MAFDPETYLTATALVDFAPLTDAQIVVGLIRADAGRSARIRSLATYLDEALAILLRADVDPGFDVDQAVSQSSGQFEDRA